MKIALSPDLHCFYSTYDRLDDAGNSIRREEWKKSVKTMLQLCKKNKVDTIIFPGDYFVNPKPTAEAVLLVSELFKAFEKSGINVVGIAGNHDIAGVGKKNMNDVVSAIGANAKWCSSSFGTTVIEDVGFAFLPFVKSPELTAYSPDYANMEMAEQLIHVAGDMKATLDKTRKVKKTILVGHWSIQGAVTSSGQSMAYSASGVETVLPLSELVAQKWDACLFGHIHKPQVLSESAPFVAYSGCIQRINIGECNDKRGFYIYDTETDAHEFLPIPAMEMVSFSKEIASSADFDALLDEIKSAKLAGKIAYVKYTVSKESFGYVNKRELIKTLDAGNPVCIAGIVPKVVEEGRQRDSSLTETLDNESALAKWLATKQQVSDDDKAKVMALFKRYSDALVEEAV